jgi:DNA-binding winged helix-turn-helix (wHTH) protein
LKVTFRDLTLDSDSRQLFRGTREVRLSPKAFNLMTLLVESRPRAIAKRELLERLWPSTYVSETSLATLVREVRAALGDDARSPQYVRTVHRFGYAFCATAIESTAILPGGSPAGFGSWLVSDNRQIPLRAGENIVGREPEATVWIDSATVSRRHARIVISGNEAMLEDLGSKNGTYLRGTRVTTPSRLVDGDEIHVGSAIVRFRMPSSAGSTATQGSSRDEHFRS